jgi:hypothetical protein
MVQDIRSVNERVIGWLNQNKLAYKQTQYGFKTDSFHIKIIHREQSIPVWKEPGDRIVFEHELHDSLKKLDAWLVKSRVIKIEKLKITTSVEKNVLYVDAHEHDVLVARSTFWIEPQTLFWFKTEYFNVHIPGWLSKVLKTLTRLGYNLPVECVTNAKHSAYEKIGFRVASQHDGDWYMRRLGARNLFYSHPENIIVWKLVYDHNSAV